MNSIFVYKRECTQDILQSKLGVCYGDTIAPYTCTCPRELNGCFELYLEGYADDETLASIRQFDWICAPILGRWWQNSSKKFGKKYQLFFVDGITRSVDGSGNRIIKIQAKHAFYILRARNVNAEFWNSENPVRNGCCGLARNIINTMQKYGEKTTAEYTSRGIHYDFTVLDPTDDSEFQKIELTDDKNAVEMIMGSGGLTDLFGVEIYRDNFTIGLRKRMVCAAGNNVVPAFRFLYGKEFSEIEEDCDWSNMITYLETNTIYRPFLDISNCGFSCDFVKSFSADAETDSEKFKQIAQHFKSVNHPDLSYTINLNDLQHSVEYADVNGLMNCDIGDIGIVDSEPLGISTYQKITRTVQDVLKGIYTEITLGNIPESTTRVKNATMMVGQTEQWLNAYGFTAVIEKKSNVPSSIRLRPHGMVYYDFGDSDDKFLCDHNHSVDVVHGYDYVGKYTLTAVSSGREIGTYGAVIDGGKSQNSELFTEIHFMPSMQKIGSTATKNGNSWTGTALFPNLENLKIVEFPIDTNYISSLAFSGCVNLKEIVYHGTIAQWKSINDKYGAWVGVHNVHVTCSDGQTTQEGALGE